MPGAELPPGDTSVGGARAVTVVSVPAITNYPAQFTLLKYTKLNGAFNFGLGALPGPGVLIKQRVSVQIRAIRLE